MCLKSFSLNRKWFQPKPLLEEHRVPGLHPAQAPWRLDGSGRTQLGKGVPGMPSWCPTLELPLLWSLLPGTCRLGSV